MKKTKLQKGITLIALIITIVVLLILAVVAINSVKDGGIISHAQKAANDYTIAQEKEKIGIGYSEYIINKNISEDADLKVEGAIVTGSEEEGFVVEFEKTHTIYSVSKNGDITPFKNEEGGGENPEEPDGGEDTIIEKELLAVIYQYNTMYDTEQPNIVSVNGFRDDTKDNNRLSDYNESLGATIEIPVFNIPITVFEKDPPQGNISATITYLNGETKPITLETTDNQVWTYNESGTTGLSYPADINIIFRKEAKYEDIDRKEHIDDYAYNKETHLLSINENGYTIPLKKLTMLDTTLEFPFNCNAIPGNIVNDTFEPMLMYTNIQDVSEITVNFSDNTNKVYTSENFYKATEYMNGDGWMYASPSVPVLYMDGNIIINMLGSGCANPITSVIIKEGNNVTKYIVGDSTIAVHADVAD